MSIRPRESERWQCSHGSGDPSGCRECKAEEREKKAREDELLNMIVRKPANEPSVNNRKSVDEDPTIRAIKERLEGKAGGKPSAAPARMESGPVPKNESLPPQETIGQVIDGIDADALEALANDLLKQPDAPGPLGEFARALKDAGSQADQAPRPAIDASKAKDKPNALRLLAQLGGKMTSPPKRNIAAIATRATMALSPASREEIKKVLAKRRRLSPKVENPDKRKTG